MIKHKSVLWLHSSLTVQQQQLEASTLEGVSVLPWQLQGFVSGSGPSSLLRPPLSSSLSGYL